MNFKKILKPIVLIALCCSMVITPISCNRSSDNGGNGDKVASEYPYYEDHGGAKYRIMNVPDKLWGMIMVLDPDEQTGDEVRDNIYQRNKIVRDNMNCDIEEMQLPDGIVEWTMNNLFEQQCLASNPDTDFDACFIPMYHAKTMVLAGYYQCLNDISTLHLEEKYWDPAILKSTSIGNKNYFATGSIHLAGFESMWCLYFNKEMMTNKGLPYPYDLVREDKWTLDKFSQYCRDAADLNGDAVFELKAPNAVFGCTSFYQVVAPLLYGLGTEFISKDQSDMPVINFTNRSFQTIATDLLDYMTTPGAFVLGEDMYNDPNQYIKLFKRDQSMFMIGYVSESRNFQSSDIDFTYGIVPLAKYAEEDDYRSTSMYQTMVLTLPITNKHPEKLCNVADALGFESEKMVIEPYFARTVDQKGTTDSDSIEMLHIIRDHRSFDIGECWKWSSDMEDELVNMVKRGHVDSISSLANSHRSAIQKSIDKSLKTLTKTQ